MVAEEIQAALGTTLGVRTVVLDERETPRLCRGGSQRLTVPGIHQRRGMGSSIGIRSGEQRLALGNGVSPKVRPFLLWRSIMLLRAAPRLEGASANACSTSVRTDRAALSRSTSDKPPALPEVADTESRSGERYAGHLGTNRAGHKGYADQFEQPKLYAGRMAMAANWPSVTPDEAASKPWLAGCPRLIFISDMGDALSHSVPFSFLRQEIVGNVIWPLASGTFGFG